MTPVNAPEVVVWPLMLEHREREATTREHATKHEGIVQTRIEPPQRFEHYRARRSPYHTPTRSCPSHSQGKRSMPEQCEEGPPSALLLRRRSGAEIMGNSNYPGSVLINLTSPLVCPECVLCL